MSSSDYIRYRRVMNGLNTLSTFPRVLTNTQYAEFKSISLEKNIQPVDKYEYWNLRPEESRVMSGILRLNPTSCPDFCDKTLNLRPNVVLQTVSEPTPAPRAPLALKQKDQNKLAINSSCRCIRTF
jgi:hypothetical protein